MSEEGLQEFFHYASKLRIVDADDWRGAGFKTEPNGNSLLVHLNERLHYQHAYVEQAPGIRIWLDRTPVTEGSVYSGKRTQNYYSRRIRYYTQNMRWNVNIDVKEDDKKTLAESAPLLKEACIKIAKYRLNQSKASLSGKSRRPQATKE